jgi:MFS family permease
VYSIRRFFFPPSIPGQYRPNFIHLYLDIGWFGILSGSAINFLSIYATRLGASGFQIGLLSSMAAAVSLVLAIPAGRWLETQNINQAVFRASVWYRLGYLLWVPLPWLFSEQAQVWALIVIALLMAIPLAPLSVGFNAVFASAVPPQWRAHVAAVRNVAFAIAFILSSLGSGFLLEHLPFPAGYQLIFGIGFLGAALSSLHLYFIKPVQDGVATLPPRPQPAAIKKALSPRQQLQTAIRFDIWETPFRNTLLVFFAFPPSPVPGVPLFPLFQVRQLTPDR